MIFQGPARKLSDDDLPRVGYSIGVGEDEIHAVLDVETRGGGFDRAGRPKMLFEPHIFFRELDDPGQRAEAVAKGLAYRKWRRGQYPPDSYPRLRQAMRINPAAALRSASWGLGQVMGFNHKLAGFLTVEAMVKAMVQGEGPQLRAMIDFIESTGLDVHLRARDWRKFARGYNGPAYAKNGYHTALAKAYEKWRKIPDTPFSIDRDGQPLEHGAEPSRDIWANILALLGPLVAKFLKSLRAQR